MPSTSKYRIVCSKNHDETLLVVVANAAYGDSSRDGEGCSSVKDRIKALQAGTNNRKLTSNLESEEVYCIIVHVTRTVS